MFEARQASQPASSQSFALFPSNAGDELARTVADRPMVLQPFGLSAIVVADNLSKSPVCLLPNGSEVIAQAATLRSLLKSVAARASGDGNQSQNVFVDGQGQNIDAYRLLMDLYNSRLDSDTLGFMPKTLSSK